MIVWTRAHQDWIRDEKLLTGTHIDFVHAPTVEFVGLDIQVDVATFSELEVAVFSSGRCVEYLKTHPKLLKSLQSIPQILCFGDTTAHKLAEVFEQVTQIKKVKTAAQMVDWLNQKEIFNNYLIVGAQISVIDWKSQLNHKGASVEHLPLYKTRPVFVDPKTEADLVTAIKKQELVAFCFASPSSVQAISDSKIGSLSKEHNVVAVAIGSTTAEECRRYFSKVEVASHARVESLIKKATLIIA